MPETSAVIITGAPGSPYTRKMLSLLRYRRIPYRFLLSNSAATADLPRPKVQLLPTFYLPNSKGEIEPVVDSSPIIRRLEADIEGRSVIPHDPVIAFLDELIEDYADEWLTKAMFHYRWTYQSDIDKAGAILPLWRNVSLADDDHAAAAKMFSERQIGRLYVVGSNAVTAPVIEASYHRFLAAFEAHLKVAPFLLGHRPGAADFAVFGQLTQLTHFDPTPMEVAVKMAPRVYAWVDIMEDLCGLSPTDGDWFTPGSLPETLGAVLKEIGRVYPPVMLANAKALMTGAETVEAEVDGLPWRQPPFPYQAKCLQWLRASHGALKGESRAQVDGLMSASGLSPLFS